MSSVTFLKIVSAQGNRPILFTMIVFMHVGTVISRQSSLDTGCDLLLLISVPFLFPSLVSLYASPCHLLVPPLSWHPVATEVTATDNIDSGCSAQETRRWHFVVSYINTSVTAAVSIACWSKMLSYKPVHSVSFKEWLRVFLCSVSIPAAWNTFFIYI